jgi:hypothetical protein
MADPDFIQAGLALAKLIALLDENGVLRWEWLGDPRGEVLNGIPNNRAQLGHMLRALLGDADTKDAPFAAPSLVWAPIKFADDQIGVGFVWDADTQKPLAIGVGAKADFTFGDKQLDLAVLARLFNITNQRFDSDLGDIFFAGVFPVPDFLQSGSISGGISGGAIEPPISLVVQDLRTGPENTRTLAISNNVQGDILAWDHVRIALFVLRAWLHKQAPDSPDPDNFFTRVDRHLFPMFGEPETPQIKPFPLFGQSNMGESLDFQPWANSVLTFDNQTAGALTFLWHLRALLTGNDDPKFFEGSAFFPLVGGPKGNTTAPDPAKDTIGAYPPPPGPAGAWFGIVGEVVDGHSGVSLALDLRAANTNAAPTRIRLAHITPSGITRPIPPDVGALAAFFNSNHLPAPADKIKATPIANGGLQITLYDVQPPSTGIAGLDGTYRLDVLLKPNQPVHFQISLPTFALNMPPSADPKTTAAALIKLLLTAAPSNTKLDPVKQALGTFLQKTLDSPPDPLQVLPLLASIAGVLGDQAKLRAGPLMLEFKSGKPTFSLSVGPFDPADLDLPVRFGRLTVAAELDLTKIGQPKQIAALSLALGDLRIGSGNGGGFEGIVGKLIPDLAQAPGFPLAIAWKAGANPPIQLTGGGKIPVQQKLGPISLSGLLVELAAQSFSLGLDLALELGPVLISAYELGITFFFKKVNNQLPAPKPFLHGLGISMDTSAVRLAGMFAQVGDDYVGAASIAVVKMFELSAIGGYTEVGGQPSLFVFASLIAPIGGTPYFFITGIAGGFGFNRALPPSGLLDQHPFLKVMRGEIPIDADITKALKDLSGDNGFKPMAGQYWIAAGIHFNSFAFINGKLVIALGVGHKFSFTLLGMASFGIAPVAYFELTLEASADEEKMILQAALSRNSYIIHRDIFSLRGGFAIGVWYGGPNAGDFVLTIGGYHKMFPKPEHYPVVAPVGVKATVFGFVRMDVSTFFALTPRALMAGAAISLAAEFGPVGAGLDVYIDVLIQWDPFYIRARLGVVVWFQFFGRIEVGVDLDIHTPPFGGLATIRLAFISFDVEFGDQHKELPHPELWELLSGQLKVPASPRRPSNDLPLLGQDGAWASTFSSADEAGLLRVEIVSGRTQKEQDGSSGQEGLTTAIVVDPEFSFAVRTRLPFQPTGQLELSSTELGVISTATLQGRVDLPLCHLRELTTTLEIKALSLGAARYTLQDDWFPSALFGAALPQVQSDTPGAEVMMLALQAVPQSLPLREGVLFRYDAQPSEQLCHSMSREEPSEGDEVFPLPLRRLSNTPQQARRPPPHYHFAPLAPAAPLAPRQAPVDRRASATQAIQGRSPAPTRIVAIAAELPYTPVLPRLKGATLATAPMGVAAIAPPPSPTRRAELFGVDLRILPTRAPAPLRRPRLERLQRGLRTPVALAPAPQRLSADSQAVQVDAGKAVQIDLTGDQPSACALAFSGQQTVRAIFASAAEEPLGDVYVRGDQRVVAPPRARRITLIGDGTDTPVNGTLAGESVGVEADTTLVALGRRLYASYGCLLELRAAGPATDPLDALPGSVVLDTASFARVHFPQPQPGWSLALIVRPNVADAGAARDDIRWQARRASLGEPQIVVDVERTAFVFGVAAPGRWAIDLNLDQEWRLVGVALCAADVPSLVARLRTQADWDLVDDHFEQPIPGLSSSVNLEIVQGVQQ